MSVDPTCGCCEGVGPITPREIYNRPGLTEIMTRVGAHPDFLETMIARLTSHALPNGTRPLQRLKARDADDPSIALLDAWAVVADVLTFYQERIANEGYLETATERRSILELGRLVGYRLRPGVAASVYLAFTLEDGYEVTIPARQLARSLPAPGENAEPFETSEPLKARDRWSALPPRLSRPYILFPETGFSGTRPAYLAGTATGLEAGQMILAVGLGVALPYVVRGVEADTEADLTTIAYSDASVPYMSIAAEQAVTGQVTPLGQLGDVLKALRLPPSAQPPTRYQLARDPGRTYAASADLGPQMLAEFTPSLRGPLFTAYANAPVTGSRPEDRYGIETLRFDAVPFGATAPLEFVYDDNGNVERREWLLREVKSTLSLEATVGAGGPATLRDVFSEEVDLNAGEAAPMDLTIQVWDPMAVPRALTLSLGELEDTGATGERVFELQRDLDGVLLAVRATYVEDSGVARLTQVEVMWRSADTTSADRRTVALAPAAVSIPLSTVFGSVSVANTGLAVSLDGQGHTIAAGEAPVQLTGADGRLATITMDGAGALLSVRRDEARFVGTPTARRVLSLDAEYDGVVAGGRLVVNWPGRGIRVFGVLEARSAARADYGLSQTVTQVLLDADWLTGREATLAEIRPVTVNEAVDLAEEPLTADVAEAEVELDGLYEGLEAGRWVAVKGERTDVLATDGSPTEGVEATELAMIAGVEHRPAQILDLAGNLIDLPGDTLHTRLTFAEPLAYTYKRDTVRVNANVVLATHGESVRETLGSGDSAARLQTFALARDPVTHVSAPTPEGTESTLTVRVNGIRWREGESLLSLGTLDRGFQSRTDNEGKTSVTFGDGLRGTRVPSGTENVTAEYRVGIGAPGNVGAGQITTLGPKPLGLKEVVNPRAASGGADAETRDQARVRVPLATRALDRLVSVEDYTDFAVLYAGIGKAQAARLPDGGREVVHLTLAGAADAVLDEQSALWRNLMTSLTELGDPGVPVVMKAREAAFLFLSAKVNVHPDHLWELVEPPLRASLLEAFGFEAREMGQPVRLSEVVAVMQAAEGVEYVDVDLFEAVAESEADTPEDLAARLEAFAARPPDAVPRPWLPAGLARRENGELRPAQLIYLNPGLADTLILTEVTS
jgi:predicted phage baseplate assembly protein